MRLTKLLLFIPVLFIINFVQARAQEGLDIIKMDSIALKQLNPAHSKYLTASFTAFFENYNAVQLGVASMPNEKRMHHLQLGYIYGLDNLFSLGAIQARDDDATKVKGGQLLYEYRINLGWEHFSGEC